MDADRRRTAAGPGGSTGAVTAGTYNLSESGGLTGYDASAWDCTAGIRDGAKLTLVADRTATCTITNTARVPNTSTQPLITLSAQVANTHSGTAKVGDFTLTGVAKLVAPAAAAQSRAMVIAQRCLCHRSATSRVPWQSPTCLWLRARRPHRARTRARTAT